MEELGKALGDFITRDVFYAVGGVLIAHPVIDLLPVMMTSSWGVLLLLVAAYPIGYLAKETFEALGLIVTGELYNKGLAAGLMMRLAKWLWAIHHREQWNEEIEGFGIEEFHFLKRDVNETQKARIVRSGFLVHMAGIMGSSFVFAALTGLFFGSFGIFFATALVVVAFLLFPFTYFHTMRTGQIIWLIKNQIDR